MCFSVNVNLVKEELENRFGATLIDPERYRPSYYYHAFGIPELPAICSGEPAQISLLKWGLIPSATKNIDEANDIRYKTFNARSESIDQKKAFSTAFKSKRCIIPVRGFFEWQHLGKDKIPWYIYHAENDILSIAGLYDQWIENKTGEVFDTFSIITTTANDQMAKIHNSAKRMPVILDKSAEKIWLDLSFPAEEIKGLLKPAHSEILNFHTIGPLVNDKKRERNTPETIRPYSYNTGLLLF